MQKYYLPETACKMVKAILGKNHPAVLMGDVLMATDGNRMGIFRTGFNVETPVMICPDMLTASGTHVELHEEYMLTYGDSKWKTDTWSEYISGVYDGSYYKVWKDYNCIRPYLKDVTDRRYANVKWKAPLLYEGTVVPFDRTVPFIQVGEILDKMDAKNAIVQMVKQGNTSLILITVSEDCFIVVMPYRL